MDEATKRNELRAQAEASLKRLARLPLTDLTPMKAQVQGLRDARQYDLMAKLAEAVRRQDPHDVRNRRLYAQCLIEKGQETVAIDVLAALLRSPRLESWEATEASGLLGRAYKQIFFDMADRTCAEAIAAFRSAVAAYGKSYGIDAGYTWHGVNLMALLLYARRTGIAIEGRPDGVAIARQLVTTLGAVPAGDRDDWHAATLAEAYLGLGEWDAAEREIRNYAAGDNAKAFLVAGTLRQFTQVWGLDEAANIRGRSILAALRARLLQLDDQDLRISPDDVAQLKAFEPERATLEAILGRDGPKTYRWMQLGLERAACVASIRLKNYGRVGTGFLVRAGDVGLAPPEELLVLTNWHVVNPLGLEPGIRPEAAEIVFEATGDPRAYDVAGVAWSRPMARHDASFLRLAGEPPRLAPMPLAGGLPPAGAGSRVYVIGYPGGRELALSLQDNELLDHEGPPDGTPKVPGVCRVHYRTPTEPGSSGSPVFDADLWEVVALHHAGSARPVPLLNGRTGSYSANEGISIGSIRQEIAADSRPAGGTGP